MKQKYPSEISREQFEEIREELETARKRTKPRKLDLYDIFNGVLYVLKSGCQWRMLPKEYPKWRSVHEYFSIWKNTKGKSGKSILDEILKKINWKGETKQWTERNHQFSHY